MTHFKNLNLSFSVTDNDATNKAHPNAQPTQVDLSIATAGGMVNQDSTHVAGLSEATQVVVTMTKSAVSGSQQQGSVQSNNQDGYNISLQLSSSI